MLRQGGSHGRGEAQGFEVLGETGSNWLKLGLMSNVQLQVKREEEDFKVVKAAVSFPSGPTGSGVREKQPAKKENGTRMREGEMRKRKFSVEFGAEIRSTSVQEKKYDPRYRYSLY